MSFSAPIASTLSGTGIPVTAETNLPASVRNGTAADKAAYAEGLQFEQMLTNQLMQTLGKTVAATASLSSNDPTADSGGGMFGSGSDASGYSSLLTSTLTSALSAGGGLGIAGEIARSIDPSFGAAAAAKAKGSVA